MSSYQYFQSLGGIGSLQQQQLGPFQQAMTTSYTTAASTSVLVPYAHAVGMQMPIEAVAPDRMEVAIDPRNWLRQRIKEIEWRA